MLRIPVKIANPDGISHTLQLRTTLIGIDPSWSLDIRKGDGSVMPQQMGPNETLGILIGLLKAGNVNAQSRNAQAAAAVDDPRVGDVSSAQVEVLLDGQSIGGFTVEFGQPARTHLPLLMRGATAQ